MEFGYSKFIKKCSWNQDLYKKSGEGTRIEEREKEKSSHFAETNSSTNSIGST